MKVKTNFVLVIFFEDYLNAWLDALYKFYFIFPKKKHFSKFWWNLFSFPSSNCCLLEVKFLVFYKYLMGLSDSTLRGSNLTVKIRGKINLNSELLQRIIFVNWMCSWINYSWRCLLKCSIFQWNWFFALCFKDLC